jgi:hypothetical protein
LNAARAFYTTLNDEQKARLMRDMLSRSGPVRATARQSVAAGVAVIQAS